MAESTAVYEIPHTHSPQIWDLKFDDCLENLEKTGFEDSEFCGKLYSELYSDIETMKNELEVYEKDGCKGVAETVDYFEDALEKAKKIFERECEINHDYSFDLIRELDNDNNTYNDQFESKKESMWWVTHHIKKMSKKAQ